MGAKRASRDMDRGEVVDLVRQNLHRLESYEKFGMMYDWTPFDDPKWTDLILFYSRAWFQRLWVVQEVNANPNITVFCRSIELSWALISLCGDFAFRHSHVKGIELATGRGTLNASTMRNRESMRNPIYTLLTELSSFQATDPRDHIYACLGLDSFANGNLIVQPDYTKPVEKIYTEFAASCLETDRTLSLLRCAGARQGINDNYPSWVPQWDKESLGNFIDAKFLANSRWKASGGFSKSQILVQKGALLMGIEIDRVREVVEISRNGWSMPKPSRDDNVLYQFWFNESHDQHRKYLNTGSSYFLAYAASICSGFYRPLATWPGNERITVDWAEFEACVTAVVEMCSIDSPSAECLERWRRYRLAAQNRNLTRQLFNSWQGHVGLGSELMAKDEIICILYGGCVPYILRPIDAHYKLIGECYVHGMMDGEAVDLMEREELKETVFEIH